MDIPSPSSLPNKDSDTFWKFSTLLASNHNALPGKRLETAYCTSIKHKELGKWAVMKFVFIHVRSQMTVHHGLADDKNPEANTDQALLFRLIGDCEKRDMLIMTGVTIRESATKIRENMLRKVLHLAIIFSRHLNSARRMCNLESAMLSSVPEYK